MSRFSACAWRHGMAIAEYRVSTTDFQPEMIMIGPPDTKPLRMHAETKTEMNGHLKFRSSMTLFARSTLDNQVFKDAVQKYFAGEFDRLTLERL